MKKKRFTVAEGETIAACLERMKREGYRPIRRVELPFFRLNEMKAKTSASLLSDMITSLLASVHTVPL
ncbi:NETI motif-containing protein [Geobacillus sp. FSL W8-0032]|uniref:NETI motif-containing protein n=1 Tax=Geobacillus TaxID=129337 RepID=UPI000518D9D3|nr:NETI motif-containing protein [Geobacillus icigianus]